jgi:Family of unknown function (DUF5706)
MWHRRRIQAEPPHRDRPGNEFAWRVHEAQQAWTASVDIKASIVLVVEGAIAAAAGRSLMVSGGVLHGAHGLHLAIAITAVTLLSCSVGAALWVVFPRLERRGSGATTNPGLIYFGHLRDRSVDEIDAALAGLDQDEERHELARQLQVTASVAWRKHFWLQASLILLAIGVVALATSLVAF